MPPLKKYDKEKIIELCLSLITKEGIDKINARRIAKELNSSVNPIFNNFKNMEELKRELYQRIYSIYMEYANRGRDSANPYKEMGLNYIRFAKDYPEFFKIIFMQESNLDAENFIMVDNAGNDVIAAGQKMTGLNFEEQKKFHIRVWFFTHGIACLVATNTINISDDEISELLESTVRQMLIGYLNERDKNEK